MVSRLGILRILRILAAVSICGMQTQRQVVKDLKRSRSETREEKERLRVGAHVEGKGGRSGPQDSSMIYLTTIP